MGELSSLLAHAPLCCLLSRAPAASTCLQATQATQRHLGDGHNRLGTRSHELAVLARPPAPSPAKEPGPSGQVQPSLAQSSFFSSLSLLVVPPDFATLLPPSHSISSYRLLPWLSFTTLLCLQLKFPLTTQESRVFALDLVLDIRHLLDGLQRLLIPVAPASLSSPFIPRSPTKSSRSTRRIRPNNIQHLPRPRPSNQHATEIYGLVLPKAVVIAT
ncbi:hypothetical protein MANI_022606 [Metarhizium anisopliae]|nr:hypothetical protein MANI_022606 [Metarhizium anisopliae]